MPGCLSYIVATDPSDPDSLWITEVFAKGRPLIKGFSNRVETAPIGGYGLPGKAP